MLAKSSTDRLPLHRHGRLARGGAEVPRVTFGNEKEVFERLKAIKEKPSFIKTVLTDVRRATSMLTQCLDALGAEVAETEAKPKKAKRKTKKVA